MARPLLNREKILKLIERKDKWWNSYRRLSERLKFNGEYGTGRKRSGVSLHLKRREVPIQEKSQCGYVVRSHLLALPGG